MPCDYSKYPPNWKTEIRPRILARAGQLIVDGKIEQQAKCENCGVPNGAVGWRMKNGQFLKSPLIHAPENPPMMIVLTIAHLDHNPENWEVQDDRLAALCQYCHLRYDAAEKARKRKAKADAVKSAGLFA